MNLRNISRIIIIVSCASCSTAASQASSSPQYSQLGKDREQGENPAYHVNRFGYGNYVQGPGGSYGGYPAGSDGAIELQNQHDMQCANVPERC